MPPGDPAADALLSFADELDARARELEAKGKDHARATTQNLLVAARRGLKP